MNILPKKNWHVRNKDNIAKVKRDEAKAAAEEKESLKRKAIAESEARINILRAKTRHGDETEQQNVKSDYINLFEREEQGKFNEQKNVETELEKKEEKEKFEKKIGLLTYLNSDQIDFKAQPWNQTIGKEKLFKTKKNENEDYEVDLKHKIKMDPLFKINNDFNIKIKHHKKSKKSSKHDNDKDDDKHINDKSNKIKIEPQKKSIEQLRAERLKRETEERAKAERLLYGDKKQPVASIELDDRKRRYNSQYNPDFARH